MMTAKEARKRINSLETERGEQEKKNVEEIINCAVEEGKDECWLGFWISTATENWLKSLGYGIHRMNSQIDGSDVQVTW